MVVRKSYSNSPPEILLYGCDVAQGDKGHNFISKLSEITGADVAASDDLTGNAELGGDWILEKATGNIETPLAFQIGVMAAYESVLANFNVTDTATLASAINNSVNGDTVTLVNNITLNADLPIITKNLDFIGNGFGVSGNNTRRVFWIGNDVAQPPTLTIPNVNFTNLKITNGLAKGGNGGNGFTGGGGGAGLGGGVFILNGNVTFNRVTFDANRAIGGNGGNGIAGVNAGGGGGGMFGNGGNGGATGGGGGGGLGAMVQTVQRMVVTGVVAVSLGVLRVLVAF